MAPAKRRLSISAHSPKPVVRSKRKRNAASEDEAVQAIDLVEMRSVVHQFGMVGGKDYDSKEDRLTQLLERLPTNTGKTLIMVLPNSASAVTSTIERCRRKASAEARGVLAGSASSEDLSHWTCGRCTFVNDLENLACAACETRRGAFPSVTVVVVDTQTANRTCQWELASCQLIINYDFPRSGAEYVRRLSALHPQEAEAPAPPRVAYTFVEEAQVKTRACREVVALLRHTRPCVDAPKAAEFTSALELIEEEEDRGGGDEEEDWGEEWDEDDNDCDCAHCRGSILGSTSYHSLLPVAGVQQSSSSGVEVVRLPLRVLEDFDKAVPFIAPRLQHYSCTLICLHCLNVHTPWDGWEQYFAPPELTGTMRVVLVLADGVSWHEYPDAALVGCGGASWVDLLDMDSMDRSDMLLERLIDHEAALLDGHSERIVLMGMSQGGGQSMLRFLRSNLCLGGWVGSVCHVPTAPHTPRNRDPLIVQGRSLVNRDRPIRLLAGDSDSVFPPGLVLRDAARLRDVGGFTDVHVEVRTGLAHEGPLETKSEAKPLAKKTTSSSKDAEPEKSKALRRAEKRVPELLFLQRYLPSMVDLLSRVVPESC